jgi:uncharacterized membrane protein YfhO
VSFIRVETYKPNYIKYQSQSDTERLAIFSEIYYPKGWNAYIDGKQAPHFRADYTLRAMLVPAGLHKIEFKFEPQVIKTGSTIALASSLGMILLLIGGIYVENKKKRQ